jgi:hypothetical protein
MPYIERLRTQVSHASIKYRVLAMSCIGLVFAKDADGMRNILPEPFDVLDHAGNINGSAQFGYAGGLLVGKLVADRANKQEDCPSKLSTRTKMALGGLSVGLLLNGLVETRFGMKLIHWENTSDPIDFAYGVGTATAVGALIPNVEHRSQLEYVPSQHDIY